MIDEKKEVDARLWKEHNECLPKDLNIIDHTVYGKEVFFEMDLEDL